MAFGFVHKEISIDFEVPKTIQNIMADLEQFDSEEDYRYFTLEEALDLECKESYSLGEISKKEWEILVRRYWSNE